MTVMWIYDDCNDDLCQKSFHHISQALFMGLARLSRGACKLRKAAEPLNPSVPLVPLDRSTAASSIQLFPCADRADS